MPESISHLVSFIYSAEEGGFSAAARRLGLSPAAVSKNVARLEQHLGVRLFQRTTRQLRLTAEGERYLFEVAEPFKRIEEATLAMRQNAGQPAGTLKIGMAPLVGRTYFVPMLEAFLRRYPAIVPDLHVENRQVDLVKEGFDVAIGGGVDLSEGMVARELTMVRSIVLAAPAYLARRGWPTHPDQLARHDGILRRALGSGRLLSWTVRHPDGQQAPVELRAVAVCDDPEAMAQAALAGIGLTVLPLPHAQAFLRSGALVNVLPGWFVEGRPLCLYYSGRRLLPAKTRVFIDFVVERFEALGLAREFMTPDRPAQAGESAPATAGA
jgi:DNA-binding transcriptional LysR family regulator